MRPSLPLLVAAVCAVALVVSLAGVGRPATARGDSAAPNTVTTTGHGSVSVVPDRATVTAGVHTQAATAAAALAKNSAEMNAVVAALEAHGGSNLQTQTVSLQPQTTEQGRVTGYAADDQVSADASIAAAGKLIDAAVAAGANTVDGPSLSVSDREGAYEKALAEAVGNARDKARALGAAGAFGVGPVSTVTEESQAPQPIAFGAVAAKSAGTPVEAGTQEVTADVTVTFRLQ
jgi:uncharacterized protein